MKIDRYVLKQLLKENKMTITSFSIEINMSRDTINNWLYRNCSIPSWRCEIIEEFFINRAGYCPEELFMLEE